MKKENLVIKSLYLEMIFVKLTFLYNNFGDLKIYNSYRRINFIEIDFSSSINLL
jgi:hypothetical protein